MIIAIPTNNSGKEIEQRNQNAAYIKWVTNAGYTPILVPMEANINDIVKISDGLLLAGGIDIDPIYYGYDNSSSFNERYKSKLSPIFCILVLMIYLNQKYEKIRHKSRNVKNFNFQSIY